MAEYLFLLSRVTFQLTKNNSLLTLKMTSALVVETSVASDGSSIQDTQLDDHFPRLESPLSPPHPPPLPVESTTKLAPSANSNISGISVK